jgi:hypothetical protein
MKNALNNYRGVQNCINCWILIRDQNKMIILIQICMHSSGGNEMEADA